MFSCQSDRVTDHDSQKVRQLYNHDHPCLKVNLALSPAGFYSKSQRLHHHPSFFSVPTHLQDLTALRPTISQVKCPTPNILRLLSGTRSTTRHIILKLHHHTLSHPRRPIKQLFLEEVLGAVKTISPMISSSVALLQRRQSIFGWLLLGKSMRSSASNSSLLHS